MSNDSNLSMPADIFFIAFWKQFVFLLWEQLQWQLGAAGGEAWWPTSQPQCAAMTVDWQVMKHKQMAVSPARSRPGNRFRVGMIRSTSSDD
ncbi:MAG: hypothetical protein GY904_04820 [Planctomycetaceae bacterium]|nr:hypothetical protein [Planctomycetaceae bacterium]